MKLQIQNYFKNLKNILRKINFLELYSLPGIFKIDLRNDQLFNYNSFKKKIFQKKYIINNLEKFETSEIIFISHYLGNIKNKKKDFYYGNLFKYLEKKKFKFSVILLNKTNQLPSNIIKQYQNFNIGTAVVDNYYNPLSSSYVLVRIFYIYIKFLFKQRKINFNKKEKKILEQKFKLSNFLASRNTIQLFLNIKKIINIAIPNLKKIILTYEGHSFEKLIISYCNKKNIHTVGYFFSVIRDFDTSIFYSMGERFNPRSVWVTGRNIKKYFNKKLKTIKVCKNIEVIGYSRQIKKNEKSFDKHKTVLFCPEGLYSETLQMFRFASNLKKKFPYLQIIFRTHPEIESFFIKKLSDLDNNIKISKNKLEKDLKNSSILVYRGSSLCINAIYANILPVYLNLNDQINLDPLFQISKFKVSEPEKFMEILNFLSNKKKFNNYLISLKQYANSYFENFNYSKIYKMLKK